ncbi:MAG: exodeoxyribonuclease VII large subunit [bacterium]
MPKDLLQKLKDWRRITAQSERVELYRVLPNKVIEDIARLKPKNKEEIMAIKGIRDKKFEKYGKDILVLTNGENEEVEPQSISQSSQEEIKDKPYSVSGYLNLLNNQLRTQQARVQGEISSLNIKENYLFFYIKDKEDESILGCFMWSNDYKLCGIDLEVGMEITAEGFPEIHKPNGSLSLKVSVVELVGEGALKRAYDQLKKKLEKEGLFDTECKKLLPDLPQKIGVISSKQGAVIHDFLNNIGQYGYQIKFMDSRVEGQTAVRDLISAIKYFGNKDIDVLVIIRGGGSLESLQAFNNEALVRRIAEVNVPVICGIGHEKDVPLASLVADIMVSTPTAVSVKLNQSWNKVLDSLRIFERDIIYKYQERLAGEKHRLEIITGNLKQKSEFIFKKFESLNAQLNNKLTTLGQILKNSKLALNNFSKLLITNLNRNFNQLNEYLNNSENKLKAVNPLRQLKLGYSIAHINGALIRSIKQIKKGDELNIQVSDGKIKSQVSDINN